jgi:hypothetical protein
MHVKQWCSSRETLIDHHSSQQQQHVAATSMPPRRPGWQARLANKSVAAFDMVDRFISGHGYN